MTDKKTFLTLAKVKEKADDLLSQIAPEYLYLLK